MKLPPIKNLLREDFPGQTEWIDSLLIPLNQFMNAVFTGLNKGLTFRENLSAVEKVLEFREAASIYPIKFAWGLPTAPTGLMVTRVIGPEPTAAVSALWTFDGSSISVSKIFGLAASGNYKITVLAFTS